MRSAIFRAVRGRGFQFRAISLNWKYIVRNKKLEKLIFFFFILKFEDEYAISNGTDIIPSCRSCFTILSIFHILEFKYSQAPEGPSHDLKQDEQSHLMSCS